MRIHYICLLSLLLVNYQLVAGKHGKNVRTNVGFFDKVSPSETQDKKTAQGSQAASQEAGSSTATTPLQPQELEGSLDVAPREEADPATAPRPLVGKTPQVKAGDLQAELDKWFWKGRRTLLQKLQQTYDPSRHIFGSPDQEETKSFIQETLKSLQYHEQYDDLALSLNFIDAQKIIDLDRSLRQSLRKTLKSALSSSQATRKKALVSGITDQSKAVDEQIKKLSVTILAADEALAEQNKQDTSVIQQLRRGLHATATLHKPGEVESDDEGESSDHYATDAALRAHQGIDTTTLLSDDNRASLQQVLALKLFSTQQAGEAQASGSQNS